MERLVILWICLVAQTTTTSPDAEIIDHSKIAVDYNASKGFSQLLTEYLLSKHNHNAPPEGHIHLIYEIELVHILEVSELRQSMTAMVYVAESWTDSTLSWDPSLFGNISKTWLPEESIWLPDVLIFNMIAHDNLLHSVRAPVIILNSGKVTYTYPAIFTVMCEINVKHFPLDTQECGLEIASWEYGEEKLDLEIHSEHSLDHYSPNEEWELQGLNFSLTHYEHEGIMVSEVHFVITLKRKPLFYMLTLVVPSYVICAVAIIGLFATFSSSGEKQERYTLGVTAILSMAVLSLVVSEKVPHSATAIPLLVAYFLFEIAVVAIATALTGVSMRMTLRGEDGEDPPPEWICRLTSIGKFGNKKKATNVRPMSSQTKRPKSGALSQNDLFEELLAVLSSIKRDLGFNLQQTPQKSAEMAWFQLARVYDRTMIVIFEILLLVPTFIILVKGDFF